MKKILTRIIASATIAATLVFLLCSCKKDETKLTKITVNEVAHSVFYAPQYAAIALGFFEEEGLDIELICGNGADKVMASVLSGESQIGLAGPEASIYVYLEGKENHAVIFSQLTKRDGSFLVSRSKEENFTFDNLKNKYVIGGRAGGVPLMTLLYTLKQQGLDPEKDLTVDSSVQFAMMAGAFSAGTGDYVTLFEPTASSIVREGKGHIVASIGEISGEIPYTAYFANKNYIKDNPEIIEKFTRAVTKGQKWVDTHSAEDIAKTIAPYFPDNDIDLLTEVTKRHKDIDAWNTNGIMTEESFNRLQDVMESAGELEKRVVMSEIVDNSFSEKVK